MSPETMNKLAAWQELVAKIKAEAKPLIDQEMAMRKELFAELIPNPKEGTQYIELANGWRLKGIHKLDRKIDEAALDGVKEQLRQNGVNPDLLVEYKPSLKSATYKELTAEQKAIFDHALIMKPGSPTLELVPPKEK